MKLSQLEYSVRKKYTIPYLPHVFYGVLFCFLCILVTVNVALVGSDLITTLKDDPDAIVNPWWMPKFWPKALRLRTPGICQPQSITDDLALRTNSSVPLFSYALRRASAVDANNDPSKRVYPAPYMANPLSNCSVRTIVWRMDLPIRTMSYKATIRCSLGGQKKFPNFKVPDNITLSMTHYRAANPDLGPDNMFDYLAFNVVPKARNGSDASEMEPTRDLGALPPNSTSANNVLAVLDGMETDLTGAVWAQMKAWDMNNQTYHKTYIVEWAAGSGNYCWSEQEDNFSGTCGGATDFNRVLRWYGTADNWASRVDDQGASFIRPFNVTIMNMLVAMRDAILMDLGNVDTASNIYLNKSYFNEVIRTDPFHNDTAPVLINANDPRNVSSDVYWEFCTYWTCVNTSWAQAHRDTAEGASVGNITLPYQPDDPRASSVFRFSYLCPVFQRKSLDSLLISVFVATATMLSVMYAIFDLFMPKVEERYQKRKRAMGGAINANPEDKQEGYALVGGIDVYDASSTLYDDPGFGPRKDEGCGSISPTNTEYLPVNARSYSYPVPEYNTRQ